MSKYHSRKVTVDGHKFDSKAEAKRYCELKILERSGAITGLYLQPRFELQEPFMCDGKRYRKIEYVADFMYYENGRMIVEDVKGMKTDVYKLKMKLFLNQYGDRLTFKEVR